MTAPKERRQQWIENASRRRKAIADEGGRVLMVVLYPPANEALSRLIEQAKVAGDQASATQVINRVLQDAATPPPARAPSRSRSRRRADPST